MKSARHNPINRSRCFSTKMVPGAPPVVTRVIYSDRVAETIIIFENRPSIAGSLMYKEGGK